MSQFCDNLEGARQAIEDNYIGCYESLSDYAEELTTSTSEVPEHLSFYIDYDRMGRDMELSGNVLQLKLHAMKCMCSAVVRGKYSDARLEYHASLYLFFTNLVVSNCFS